jgi:hypothetical protein
LFGYGGGLINQCDAEDAAARQGDIGTKFGAGMLRSAEDVMSSPQFLNGYITILGLFMIPEDGMLVGADAAACAAATSSARSVVSSAGETTMFLRAGSGSLEVTFHAALRMAQRGISIDQAEATLSQQPFQYFYQGAWQTGYYDPASRIFIGSANGRITTVIKNVSQNYINNLLAAKP